MPVGLQVNDYDSEEDVSSTEDDNLNLPVVNRKNKKIKSKKKGDKSSILKESKIVKDKARAKIKNMENKVKDINSVNYLDNNKEKHVTFEENDEIREFFTDEDLADQFAELKKLEANQKLLWKYHGKSHLGMTDIQKTKSVIRQGMPLLGWGLSIGGLEVKKKQELNEARTKKLNSSSRVNTSLPINRKVKTRSYDNIGSMW